MLVFERAEIEAAIDLQAMATAIEHAYTAASAGEIELPPVGHITFPTVDGDCHIKFGHHRGEPDFVIKVATGFPQHARLGGPTGNGVLLVLSAETGQVRASTTVNCRHSEPPAVSVPTSSRSASSSMVSRI